MRLLQLECDDCQSRPMQTLSFVQHVIWTQGCKNNRTAGSTCRLAGLPRADAVPEGTRMCSHSVCVERALLGFWPVGSCLMIADRTAFVRTHSACISYTRIKDKANAVSVMQL